MIMGNHKKRDKPHQFDYALASAYETIESEKCPKCAVPIWLAYTENQAVAYEHKHIDCWSCAFDEAETKNIKNPKPGRTLYVNPIVEEGYEALPTRADFQEELMLKYMKEAEKQSERNNQED